MSEKIMSNAPDIYNSRCPSRHLLNRIGDKWSVMILGVLRQNPIRFGALKRACAGVSQKVLTQTLRNLERDGLISRKVLQQKPLQVEYTLSDLGQNLAMYMQPLIDWVHHNYKQIESTQKIYDGKLADFPLNETPNGRV